MVNVLTTKMYLFEKWGVSLNIFFLDSGTQRQVDGALVMISKRFPGVDLAQVDVPALNDPLPAVTNPLIIPEIMQVIPGITQVNSSLNLLVVVSKLTLFSLQNSLNWQIFLILSIALQSQCTFFHTTVYYENLYFHLLSKSLLPFNDQKHCFQRCKL